MKPCWMERGLTKEGARQAQSVVDEMQKLVRRVGGALAEIALREATFREDELPKRTPDFQKRYAASNGMGAGWTPDTAKGQGAMGIRVCEEHRLGGISVGSEACVGCAIDDALRHLETARPALRWVRNHAPRHDERDQSHAELALEQVLKAIEALRGLSQGRTKEPMTGSER